MNDNPLAVAQREKSGALTFEKYEYQYHWALCRVIYEHGKSNDYALFMEYHEDVVLADSLDKQKAKFEFNQIKNIVSPKYNITNLTKRNKSKNSVLGKLILSVNNKPFCDKITTINLVASCGFKIDQIDNGLDLEIISVGDLSPKSIMDIKNELKNELGNDLIPPNLKFVVPKFHIKGQQEYAIAKIAELVNELFPNSHCNSGNIYRILIDELHRKGIVPYDYKKWDDLLIQKALTSKKVQNTIQTHTTLLQNEQLFDDLNQICNELCINYLEKRSLKKIIERIHIERVGFPSALSIRIKKGITRELEIIGISFDSEIKNLIEEVENKLSWSLKEKIGSNLEVKASIIYEILVGDI